MPRYLGIRFRQATGKELVSFVAPAEEIRTWAGVPHKTTSFLGGFQRPLGARFEQIIDFFDADGNCSPTSVVVAFREKGCRIRRLYFDTEAERLSLSETDNRLDTEKDFGGELVVIEVPEFGDELTLSELAARVHRLLSDRTENEVVSEDETEDGEEDEQAVDTDPEEELSPEDVSEDDWGVDVGRSALRDFADNLANENSLNTWLSRIDDEIKRAEPGHSNPRAEAEKRLRSVLESLLAPAMIVDGQHRVWGAAESTQTIPFSVCAILDASWEEQVFQFVVINKQAKAISKEFLASIVNSSLTNREIQALEDRLESAGISTYETRMLRTMNDDPDSPFSGMISRGLEKESRKITFKAAMAIATRWHRKMNDRDPVYKTLFRPTLPGSTNAEKAQAWLAGLWKDHMFAFWSGIRNLYRDEQLWDPGMQLMYRATLEVLQDNFLQKKAQAGESFGDPVELREAVESFYGNVPAGFFHTEWKRKELLTSDGRQVLAGALNKMRVPGTKLKSLTKGDELFTNIPKK